MKPRIVFSVLLAVFTLGSRQLHADTRGDFLQLIDRPRVALAPEIKKAHAAEEDQARIDFTYAADADNRVPSILLKSSSSTGRRPVVIALHGTGGTKESQLAFMTELARAGF